VELLEQVLLVAALAGACWVAYRLMRGEKRHEAPPPRLVQLERRQKRTRSE
jgi:hypothetical protein